MHTQSELWGKKKKGDSKRGEKKDTERIITGWNRLPTNSQGGGVEKKGDPY